MCVVDVITWLVVCMSLHVCVVLSVFMLHTWCMCGHVLLC